MGAAELEERLRGHIASVSEGSEEIGQENAVAVRSLQFEDIARQILERSGQDLADLEQVIRSVGESEPSDGLVNLAQSLIEEKKARAAHKPSQATVTAGEIELF